MEESQKLAYKNKTGTNITALGYESTETLKLLVQRSLNAVVYLRFLEYLTILSAVTDCFYLEYSVTFHNLCATHNMVRRICGIAVEKTFVGSLMTQRLTGKS